MRSVAHLLAFKENNIYKKKKKHTANGSDTSSNVKQIRINSFEIEI